MSKGDWEHIEHDADIGVCGYGSDAASAFEQAGLALTAIITGLDKVEAKRRYPVHCEAPSLELLFIEWLNQIIYLMSTEKVLFSRFQVNINGNVLDAIIHGETINQQHHEPAVEIKGATFTGLEVAQRDDGSWQACTIVDV